MNDSPQLTELRKQLQVAYRHADNGDAASALAAFEAALRLEPTHQPARLARAEMLLRLKRVEEAQAGLESLLSESAPTIRHQLLFNLGLCIQQRQTAAAALPLFAEAAQLAPKLAHIQLGYAECLMNNTQYDLAEQRLSQLLEQQPDLLQARLRHARCVLLRAGAEAALPHFKVAWQQARNQLSTVMAYADCLRQAGRVTEALAVYQEAAQQQTPQTALEMGIAQCLRVTAGPAAARPHFQAALRLSPSHLPAGLGLAEVLLDSHDWQQAQAHFEAMLQSHPHDIRLHLGMARCARLREGPQGAQQYLRNLPVDLASQPLIQLSLADNLLDAGDSSAALPLFLALPREGPHHARIELGLARCYRELDGLDAALPHYAAAAALAPHGWPRQQYALALLDRGLIEQAQQQFAQLMEHAPDRPAGCRGLARCHWLLGRPQQALQMLSEALAHLDEQAAERLSFAALYREWGAYAEAQACVATLAQGEGGTAAQALAAIGDTLAAQGQYEQALQHYRRAQAVYPAGATSYRLRSVSLLRRQGDLRQAGQALQEALQQGGAGQATTLLQLAELAFDQRDFGAALLWLEQHLKATESPSGAVLLGRTLAELGQVEAALQVLGQCQENWPGRPETRIWRMWLLSGIGQAEEACALARQASRDFPAHFPLRQMQLQVLLACGAVDEAATVLDSLSGPSMAQQADVLVLRARLLSQRWQLQPALQKLQQALALVPHHAGALNGLISAELLAGRAASARQYLLQLAQREALRKIQKGESSNASQSHLGQLVDEYLINAATLKQLQQILSAPAAEQIEPLRLLLRGEQASTAAAISLLVALRLSGEWDAAALRPAGRTRIPASIVQFWDSASPPTDIQRYTRSWQAQNPDYAYRLFDETQARALLADCYSPREQQAYESAREPAMRADYFRLAYLARFGGYYADADDCCRRPIAQWQPADCELLLWQEAYGTTGNNFIGAVPGHPVILKALESATLALERGDEDLLWLATGPGLLSRALATYLAETDWRLASRRIAVLSEPQLRSAVTLHAFASYKNTGRHWLRALSGGASARRVVRT